MNKKCLSTSPILVLSRDATRATLAKPVFAWISLTPETVSRIMVLERARLEHQILWLTIDDIDVAWDVAADPVEVTRLTLHRRKLTLQGVSFDGRTSYATTPVRLSRLEEMAGQQKGLFFVCPHRWTPGRVRSFERNALKELVRQGHLQTAVCDKQRKRMDDTSAV